MKIKTISITTFFYFALFVSIISASQIAITHDGKKVELHEDGTYSFIKEKESNTYEKIKFVDFLIDSKDMVGRKIVIRGIGPFSNIYGKKFPNGEIYQNSSFTGPTITIVTSELSREYLKIVHTKCVSSCNMEVSGVVRRTKYLDSQFIEAESIKLVDRL